MSVHEPVPVVESPSLEIKEFFGRVSSNHDVLSACVCTVSAACEEAYQAPEFDEYVLVLEGTINIKHSNGEIQTVEAGKGLFLPKNTRVKWMWPGPCKYVPICVPAFSPSNCHREEEEGPTAKTEESMDHLRQLHAALRFPFLFHAAQKSLWEEAKADGKIYYPPTYKQDSFTHATANPSALVDVLNHFYTDVPGDWLCLRMTNASLQKAGISTTFESTAPVGDKPAFDAGDELFPHVQGGIPTTGGVVFEELPIHRDAKGNFTGIPGIFEDAKSTPASPPATPGPAGLPGPTRYGFASGFIAGLGVAVFGLGVLGFVASEKK